MKKVNIRAYKSCDSQTLRKTINGYEVTIQRKQFDDWNDLEIFLKVGDALPPSGQAFDLQEVCESYDILDISSDTHIQFDELTEIPKEIREQVDHIQEEDDLESTWELIESRYVIDQYKLLDD